MSPDDFVKGYPGDLVPTAFEERGTNGADRVVTGHAFVPAELPPNLPWLQITDDFFDLLTESERRLSELNGLAMTLENPALLVNPFMTREARASSAIEETFASAQELTLLDFDAVDPGKRGEIREVKNYFDALQHGVRSELPVCNRLVLELHSILMRGVARHAGQPGRFRQIQVAIGGDGATFETARFVPPPAEAVPECLGAWENYVNGNSAPKPRLIRFALCHYQFETIHPFVDGNGRIGRLVAALQLCKQAQLSRPLVYVSGYFEQHRQRYYDTLLRVSTHGDWAGWIRFFLEAVAAQAEDAMRRARELVSLRRRYQDAVRFPGASGLLPTVVDHLFRSPAVTIDAVAKVTGTQFKTASRKVDRLVSLGILEEITGKKRDRVYAATELLRMIDEK